MFAGRGECDPRKDRSLPLLQVACGSRSWGDVALPEDLEAGQRDRRWRRFLAESDDEDFALEDYSGGGCRMRV